MRSFQSKLIISYSVLIIVVFSLVVAIFCMNVVSNIHAQEQKSTIARAESVSTALESKIRTMSDASIRCLLSERFKQLFYDNLREESSAVTIHAKREMTDIIYSTSGPILPFRQAYFIHQDGRVFSTGWHTGYHIMDTLPGNATEWTGSALENSGKLTLRGIHEDDFGYIHEPVFSITRAFAKTFVNEVDAVLEIQERYSVLEELITEQCPNDIVFILDDTGNPFFISPMEEDISFDLQDELQQHASRYQKSITIEIDGTKYIAAHTYSSFLEMHVWVLNSTNDIITPFKHISPVVTIVLVLALIATMISAYFLGKRLTIPLRKVQDSINSVELKIAPNELQWRKTDLNDLEQIDIAFSDMCERLNRAVDDIVQLRSYEMEARLHAYQMQMEPHFLQNILTIIGIQAEQGNVDGVSETCKELSSMLRYVSAMDSNQYNTLEEELTYTMRYIGLMKLRYPNAIHFSMDVPVSLFCKKVPRLMIQPLVENCIKYGCNHSGEWNILITGEEFHDYWQIQVTDDGPGFNNLEDITNLPGQHIGLDNIQKRLDLSWNGQASLNTGNLENGGACVTITIYTRRLDE